ncbi:MAG: T9SS type A sorting domain-containing protein [Bacteroidia bacterium]
MKYTALVVMLLIGLEASAQNYLFLNSDSKKTFVSLNPPYNGYSIAFDSVKNFGTDTAYYNFLLGRLLTPQIPSNCPFWGSGCMLMRDLPSWIGHPVEYVSSGTFRFYNINGDTLHFDLNLSVGDTSVFYSDSLQIFKIVFELTDTINVAGYSDSANFYRVLHTDTLGNFISSALNQQQVIVAKDIGLIKFFRVDSFPQILEPLVMAGNNFTQTGITELTNEMVYDYQPGDEIQTRFYVNTPGGPPSYNFTSYSKFTFLSRTDLPDSITYMIVNQWFYKDSTFATSDTIEMKYYRYDTIAAIPFEFYDDQGKQRLLSLEDYCGQFLLTYQIYNPNYLIYCPAENCYGTIDVFADPYHHYYKYVAGLGLFEENSDPMILGPSGISWLRKKIIYFKKNGITCGQELFAGINDPISSVENISLFPNPVKKIVHLKVQNYNHGKIFYQVRNTLGTLSSKGVIAGNESDLDVSQLENGIYFLEFFSENKTIAHKKFIKAN